MTNHQKRLSAPTSWPVERKTDTFTVKADAGPHGEDGVPLLILLRDVLGYVDTRSEANYALSHDAVLVNGQPVSDEERPIGMFDILAFTERDEFYRVFPDEGGRLSLTGIDEDAADSKLGKVVGKRQIAGGDTQLTLHDGETLLVDDVSEYDVGGSLVVDNDEGSIVAYFPFETGALVTAVDGSHAGEIGTVDEIQIMPGSSANTVTVETDDGSFETIEEYVVVIDENFTAGDTEEPDEAETADSDQAGEEQDDEEETDVEAEDDDSDEAGDDAGADSTAEAEDDGGDDE